MSLNSKNISKPEREELLHCLPDYINGKIEDSELLAQIKNELQNSTQFKNEYESLRITMGFLDKSELESPGDLYFTNLSVVINDRLKTKTFALNRRQPQVIWKFLLPVISIIIIALMAYYYFEYEKEEVQVASVQDKNHPEAERNSGIQDNVGNEQQQSVHENNTAREKDLNGTTANSKTSKVSSKKNKTLKEHKNSAEPVIEKPEAENNLVADNIELSSEETEEQSQDVFMTNEDEEEILEDEFFELSPDQQNEILESLKQSQI